MKLGVGLENNTADIRLGIDGEQRVVRIGRPDLHLGVVRPGCDETRIDVAEAHAPTSLLVLLVGAH